MVNDELLKLLDKYKIDRNFTEEIRNGYRNQLEDDINSYLNEKPNYRYGGSLAKNTANTNSCDIDLLCYMDSDSSYSVEKIYNEIANSLSNNQFIIERKNSAICVTGKNGEDKWDISVDVVPGKYTSNENNKDVYLWCNKDKARLKSNPEIQIEKVKTCCYKDLIRLVKLYRTFKNFKFKSFYLEIYIIDYLSKYLKPEETLYNNLVIFSEHYDDIGNVKLVDPANIANDISNIHSSYEFEIIRNNIKELYNALLTDDENTIINCILNKPYDLGNGYFKSAKSHSPMLNFKNKLILINSPVLIRGEYFDENLNNWITFDSNSILKKNVQLKFIISVIDKFSPKDVKLIVSNAGYDAVIRNKCPRGKPEETKFLKKNNMVLEYYRNETTSYFGNHVVQAIVATKNGNYYSNLLHVCIR